jgi:hypothetical protein
MPNANQEAATKLQSLKLWLSQHRLLVCIIGGIAAYLVFVMLSPTFQECMKANQSAEYKKSIYDNLPAFLGTTYWCGGIFVKENGEAITALATVIMAIFTGTLWWASAEQGRLTQQSIELATKEFIATHRPKLRIRLLAHKPFVIGKPIEFIFAIANVGDSSAMKVSYIVRFKMPSTGRDIPEIKGRVNGRGEFVEITAGAQADINVVTDFVCPPQKFIGYSGGRFTLRGLVSYLDANGVMRITSFDRVAKEDGQGGFRLHQPIDTDFEYEG